MYHHVMPLARISLTLSRHFFLSFIASGRSSGLGFMLLSLVSGIGMLFNKAEIAF